MRWRHNEYTCLWETQFWLFHLNFFALFPFNGTHWSQTRKEGIFLSFEFCSFVQFQARAFKFFVNLNLIRFNKFDFKSSSCGIETSHLSTKMSTSCQTWKTNISKKYLQKSQHKYRKNINTNISTQDYLEIIGF